jgi:hypothetical protein
MPRNLFMPSDVVPIKTPQSSVTVGEAISRLANAMGITAQRAKRDNLRGAILEEGWMRTVAQKVKLRDRILGGRRDV